MKRKIQKKIVIWFVILGLLMPQMYVPVKATETTGTYTIDDVTYVLADAEIHDTYKGMEIYIFSDGMMVLEGRLQSGASFQGNTVFTQHNDKIKKVYINMTLTDNNGIYMFANLTSLEKVMFGSSFECSSLNNITAMFYGCTALTECDLRPLATADSLNMKMTFMECWNLKQVNLNGVSVSDFSETFRDCKWIMYMDLTQVEVKDWCSLARMFQGCIRLVSAVLPSAVISDITGAFRDCIRLETVDWSNVNGAQINELSEVFNSCASLQSIDFSPFCNIKEFRWDVLTGCTNLKELDLSGMDLSEQRNVNSVPMSIQKLILPKTYRASDYGDYSPFDGFGKTDYYLVTNKKVHFLVDLAGANKMMCTYQDYKTTYTAFHPEHSVYAIRLISNYGSTPDTIYCESGSKIVGLEQFKEANNNQILEGWYLDKDFQYKWDSENDVVTGGMKLYAKWRSSADSTMNPAATVVPGQNTPELVNNKFTIEGTSYVTTDAEIIGNYYGMEYYIFADGMMILLGAMPETISFYGSTVFTQYNEKIKKIYLNMELSNENGIYLFHDLTNLTNITCGPDFSAKNLHRMDGMFEGCSSLKSCDLTPFQSIKLMYLDYIFSGCSSLETVNMDGVKVSSMQYIFYYCSALKSVDISKIITGGSCAVVGAFEYCTSLENVKFPPEMPIYWINSLFGGCENLKNVDFWDIDFSEITLFDSVFFCCSNLESVDLSKLTNVTNINDSAFYNCNQIKILDFSKMKLSEQEETLELGLASLKKLILPSTFRFVGDDCELKFGQNYEYVMISNEKMNLIVDQEGVTKMAYSQQEYDTTYTGYNPQKSLCVIHLKSQYGYSIPAVVYCEEGGKLVGAEQFPDENYLLEGWYTDSDYSSKWNMDEDVVTDEMTLYAKWIDKPIPTPSPIPTPTIKPTKSPIPVSSAVPTQSPIVSSSMAPTAEPMIEETEKPEEQKNNSIVIVTPIPTSMQINYDTNNITKKSPSITNFKAALVYEKMNGEYRPAAKLNWEVQGDVDKYILYRSFTGKNFQKYKTLNIKVNNQYTDTMIKKGKTVYYRIQSQSGSKKSNKSKIIKLKVPNTLIKPLFFNNRQNRYLIIHAKRVEGKYYETQYRYLTRRKKWKRLMGMQGKIVKKIKAKIQKAGFQIRIRTFTENGRKVIYSKWSSAMTVKG